MIICTRSSGHDDVIISHIAFLRFTFLQRASLIPFIIFPGDSRFLSMMLHLLTLFICVTLLKLFALLAVTLPLYTLSTGISFFTLLTV